MKDNVKPVAVVICAAGVSSRMDGVKKEYRSLGRESKLTVLGSAVRPFTLLRSAELIAVAYPQDPVFGGEEAARLALGEDLLASRRPRIIFAQGGKTRRASVYNALLALEEFRPRYVLIHDGARPWVTLCLIERVLDAVKKHNAAVPLLSLTETPKECDKPLSGCREEAVFIKTHLKRSYTGAAQTPQGFLFPEILEAHKKAAQESFEFTDDAEIWGRYAGQAAVVEGEAQNRKITFEEDFG